MPTLSVMRAAVIREADVSGIVDNADVDALLNGELAELHEKIVLSHEDYYASTSSPTIGAGADSFPLPSDCFKVRDVEDMSDTDEPRSMKTFEFMDRNRLRGATEIYTDGWSGAKRYCVHGSNVLVRPSAIAPGSFRLTYVPTFTALSADGDTFTAPNDWHLYGVYGAAARLRDMQDLDGSKLQRRKEAIAARIDAAARARNIGQPRKARDVYGYRRRRDPWGEV